MNDFIKHYRRYLASPEGRLKRLYKRARFLGAEVDDAHRIAAAEFEQEHGYCFEVITLFVALERAVIEECPAECPWLAVDPDFIRATIEQHWPPLITREMIEVAVSWIGDRAAE